MTFVRAVIRTGAVLALAAGAAAATAEASPSPDNNPPQTDKPLKSWSVCLSPNGDDARLWR